MGGTGSEFIFTPTPKKDCDLGFLNLVGLSDPEAIHVVIGDGAGFHHKNGDAHLPGNVKIISLSPYCAELNPTEKLWDIIKGGICNQLWKNLESLEEAITEKIRPYGETQRT